METIYASLREELLAADALLHWLSLIVLLSLLVGAFICEARRTVLCMLLPLLSVAWAASVVRLDFFIHRIGAYLQPIEERLLQNTNIPSWESWKSNLIATKTLVPVADIFIFISIIAVTAFVLRGPTRAYFEERRWRGAGWYSAAVLIVILMLLSIVQFIPTIAGR